MRGEIANRERAKQIRDFTKLKWNKNITPTDNDGFVDFGNKIFIDFELKLNGNDLPNGQKMAFERKTDALFDAGKIAYFLIAEHETPLEEDIDCSQAKVIECRYHKKWHQLSGKVTLKKTIDKILKKNGEDWRIIEDAKILVPNEVWDKL